MNGAQAGLLADGRRLHLQHGPIDLIVEAFGPSKEISTAYKQARNRFETLLAELVVELSDLRKPAKERRAEVHGATAVRMIDAVWPHRETFVTPMAAVAGSVADEVMEALLIGRSLEKAYINNSGDIAVYLTPGATLRLGIVGNLFQPQLDGKAELTFDRPVRGVATSGWQGRSWSFGIADAVTVLAISAAAADVAATLIANAVDVDHPAIERSPASKEDDQTELGERLVTVNVGDLDAESLEVALKRGMNEAKRMLDAGLIIAAVLVLKNEIRTVGDVPAALMKTAN